MWIRAGGEAQRCPVQFEKTKTVLAESAIYFFSVSRFKPRTPSPRIASGPKGRRRCSGRASSALDSVFCPMPPHTPQQQCQTWPRGRHKSSQSPSGRSGFDPSFSPAVGTDCDCRGSLTVSAPWVPAGQYISQTKAARRARECPPQAGFFFMGGSEGSRRSCCGSASLSLSLFFFFPYNDGYYYMVNSSCWLCTQL